MSWAGKTANPLDEGPEADERATDIVLVVQQVPLADPAVPALLDVAAFVRVGKGPRVGPGRLCLGQPWPRYPRGSTPLRLPLNEPNCGVEKPLPRTFRRPPTSLDTAFLGFARVLGTWAHWTHRMRGRHSTCSDGILVRVATNAASVENTTRFRWLPDGPLQTLESGIRAGLRGKFYDLDHLHQTDGKRANHTS